MAPDAFARALIVVKMVVPKGASLVQVDAGVLEVLCSLMAEALL